MSDEWRVSSYIPKYLQLLYVFHNLHGWFSTLQQVFYNNMRCSIAIPAASQIMFIVESVSSIRLIWRNCNPSGELCRLYFTSDIAAFYRHSVHDVRLVFDTWSSLSVCLCKTYVTWDDKETYVYLVTDSRNSFRKQLET